MYKATATDLHATGLPHGQGREVGVGAGTVPVASHRLRVEGHHHAKVFSHPELVFPRY